jgi:hypothetical protein
MLDLEPIRARLNLIMGTDLTPKPAALAEYFHEFSECGDWRVLVAADRWDEIPPMALFISHASADIAALIAEVEALRGEDDIGTLLDEADTREAEIERLRAELAQLKADLRSVFGAA